MLNFDEQNGEAKAVGWISMSDLFMMSSITMLAVAVAFAIGLQNKDTSLTSVKGEYDKYRTANTKTIDDLKANVALLSAEGGNVKAQAAGMARQLSDLKAQLVDTESQLARAKDEAAKYKARGEELAGELKVQTSKLNTVQSDFDKYRTINSMTVGELKTELIRITKDADTYKESVANLSLQVSALNAKLSDAEKQVTLLTSDRDKYKTESARLAADLDKQKAKAEADLAKLDAEMAKLKSELAAVSGDLTKVSGELARSKDAVAKTNTNLATANKELAKVGAEKDDLLAELNSRKNAYAILQQEENELKLKLNSADAEKKKLEARLSDLSGTVVGLTDEIGVLKPQLTKLNVDLAGAKLRIIDLEKAVFEKINRAKMVVTLTAQDVPKGFTLELFVFDPLGNDCGPYSSVIFNDGDEIGVLQQSVDFKSGNEGSQKAVFYTSRPISARTEPGRKYTVKAMIRHNGNDENARLPRNVLVKCNIDLPNVQGPEAHQFAKLEITSPGYINKMKQTGTLTATTPYKNMWPWEPVYHFERTVCDFRYDGDRITDLRTFDDAIVTTSPSTGSYVPAAPRGQESKIESIRQR